MQMLCTAFRASGTQDAVYLVECIFGLLAARIRVRDIITRKALENATRGTAPLRHPMCGKYCICGD
jgi:dihydroxyacid dehydratase/phosphogluconate dehydratase